MSLQYYEYGLERLQRMVDCLSGKQMDAKSDLLKAFKTGNWLVDDEIPDTLKDNFRNIDNLVTRLPKDEKNNSWVNSINSLNQDTCEQLATDIKSLKFSLEIYILRNN